MTCLMSASDPNRPASQPASQTDARMTHILKEDLEHATGLLVNETRDTLNTPTTRETTNSRLGDSLDIIAKDLPVALRTALSEALSTLHIAAAHRHVRTALLLRVSQKKKKKIHVLSRVQTFAVSVGAVSVWVWL